MDKAIPHPEYNYRVEPELARGTRPQEVPGVSCFLRDGGQMFHTYSAYARGTDAMGGAYTLLDMTALGRQEDWRSPRGGRPGCTARTRRSPTEGPHGHQHRRTRTARPGQSGDEGAFAELVGPHRGELRAYCYRMLGSVHDAEDALQDALLRAWRGCPDSRAAARCAPGCIPSPATPRWTSPGTGPGGNSPVTSARPPGTGPSRRAVTEPLWLEPYPDQWLPAASPPEARYEQRESVELAFLIALQRLPPRQRAVLILRDVLGFSAAEIASQLGTSARR